MKDEDLEMNPMAWEFLKRAQEHMDNRASTYDAPGGERSMSKAVEMFNILTGLPVTDEQGWLFMALLKIVRCQQGNYRADNYEDGAAYMALAGETASRTR